jgi:hypothetical protein
MKKLKFVLLATLLVASALFFAAPAQAYLHVHSAENKARTNSWNLLCGGAYGNCPTYPWVYRTAERVNNDTVDTFIRVWHRSYGTCNRRIRVTGSDADSRVMEGQSGWWACY